MGKPYWNYRLLRITGGGDSILAMKEVHYDATDKPVGYGDSAVVGDDVDEIGRVLDMMRDATKKPILTLDDFKRSG